MYTWGYIKENTLSKLNLDEEAANQLNFLSRFPYYANEAMTQICTIKPDYKFFDIEITADNLNAIHTMPDDFVAFSDDIVCFLSTDGTYMSDIGDEYIDYVGHNKIRCKYVGAYSIPYKARWFVFTKNLPDSTVISAPADILDAIPSYITSQCYKIDDEVKAAIYRNEYEMFLARIDDTNFKTQRTFHVGGGW